MVKANTLFDIVIAGGGLSGCLMALSLAKLKTANNQALNVAIIEANDVDFTAANQGYNSSFDARVLALSHGSAAYLEQLGAWRYIQEFATPIETIHISDRGHYGKARVYAHQHHVDALGYVVEMQALGRGLLHALQALNDEHKITWFSGQTIKDICWQTEQVDISLNEQLQLNAKLLLACDGAHSVCRRFANIQTTEKPYGQSAVIANVRMKNPHNNIAYERFTEHGPIAMLPLTEQRCSLVWTLPTEQAELIKQCSDDDFIAQLNQAFGFWQGGVVETGKRFVYPLSLVQASENVYHRMALIGNASHTIHPIAGQGFNLGVRDVEQLSKVIENTLGEAGDLGNFSSLNRYAQQRLQDQQHIIALTDSLVTLFANDLPPLIAGRNIALKALNYFSPIKQGFVNKTMGY